LLAHSIYKTEFTAGLGATIAFKHISILFPFLSKKADSISSSNKCNPLVVRGLHSIGIGSPSSVTIKSKAICPEKFNSFTAGLGATIAFKHISVPKIDQFVQHVVKELNFSGQI
ncbi:hypothetical protein ACUOA8_47730, partial [Escherichia sp. SS-MK2]